MYVYVITNSVNDKTYVGQHAGEDLDAYLRHNVVHALSGIGNKTYFYRAIRKYGADKFFINPLVKCSNKEELDQWEKFWIASFKSQNSNFGYNITAGGGGRLGTHYKHTEEFKRQVSIRHKGKIISEETKLRMSLSQKGRKFTEDHKQKLRLGQIGKPKGLRSPEHCQKISENKKIWWAMKKEVANGICN